MSQTHRVAPVLILFYILLFVSPAKGVAKESGDFWIKTSLESLIEKDGHLDLEDVWVKCENGEVKIAGIARTEGEKGLATELAMEIPGVKKIENLLVVEHANDVDSKLEKKARQTLENNSLLQINELSFRARNGKITIWGIVRHFREKRMASELLFDLPEIKRVINKIEVLPK